MVERGGPLWIAKLGTIAATELGVPVRIMAVPLAQLVGGRDLLAPVIEPSALFAESPRPQSVDKHALPVFGFWRLVHPTNLHLRCLRHQVPPSPPVSR